MRYNSLSESIQVLERVRAQARIASRHGGIGDHGDRLPNNERRRSGAAV